MAGLTPDQVLERQRLECEEAHARSGEAPLDLDERRVDAVDARARHEAHDPPHALRRDGVNILMKLRARRQLLHKLRALRA